MLGHFQNLLEGIVANPDQRIGELALLTEAERRQLLIEWNDTGREIAPSRNVVEMFERQVELSPDAIAVVHESSRLTYQETESAGQSTGALSDQTRGAC
jgi:non-ribosomal peptide synthetase component F